MVRKSRKKKKLVGRIIGLINLIEAFREEIRMIFYIKNSEEARKINKKIGKLEVLPKSVSLDYTKTKHEVLWENPIKPINPFEQRKKQWLIK